MAFERRILTRYDASTAGFDRGTRRVEQQLARLQRTTETRLGAIDRRFARAGRAALQLGASIAAIQVARGIGEVRQYAEAWRSAGRSLEAAGFGIDGNREKLTQLAVRVRGDFAQTAQAVSRFSRTTGDDLETSIRRVETLRKLFSVGGSTSQEAGGVTLQLLQGLQSGTLQGEELKAIREAAPIELLDALAKQAGVARGELKKVAAEGLLTGEVVTRAIDSLAATADEKFAALAISGSEAFEVLATGFTAFFGNLDRELGATEGLNNFLASTGTLLSDNAEAAKTFADALEIVAVTATALVSGRVASGLAGSVVASRAAAAELVRISQQEVVASRAALAAAQQTSRARAAAAATATNKTAALRSLASANTALTAAEIRATTATQALSAAQARLSIAANLSARAMGVLRGALAFFGGVPGLIFAAVTAAVIFKDELFGTAEAAGTAEEAMARLDSKIAEAETQMRSLADTQRSLESDTEALKTANERLAGAIELGEAAAISAATAEVQAISRRIAANEALRQKYVQVLAAQRVAIQAEAQVASRAFNNEFGARFEDVANTGALTEASFAARSQQKERAQLGLIRLKAEEARANKRVAESIDEVRSAAVAAATAGRATDDDLRFLKADADLAVRRQQVEDLGAAIAEIEAGGAVGAVPGSAGSGAESPAGAGGGGGGRSAAEKVPADILAAQQERNQALLEELRIDEQLLAMRERLLAAGVESSEADRQVTAAKERLTAVLERNRIEQELLQRAQEEGVEITPALRTQISGLADEYLRLQLAQQGVAEQDDRLIEQGREAADAAEGRKQAIADLSDTFSNLIQNAESLEDALKKVAIELANLIVQATQGQGPLAALFGGGGGLNLFGGGGGGSGAITSHFGSSLSGPQAGFDPRFFHKGGVVGRGGTPAGGFSPALWEGAPRLHGGGIIGPNEVPAILERGEIVVPKNVGMGREVPNVTIGDTNISITEPGMTEAQLQRVLAKNRAETVQDVQRLWRDNPRAFPRSI